MSGGEGLGLRVLESVNWGLSTSMVPQTGQPTRSPTGWGPLVISRVIRALNWL